MGLTLTKPAQGSHPGANVLNGNWTAIESNVNQNITDIQNNSDFAQGVDNKIGNLSQLQTTANDTIVNAINEVNELSTPVAQHTVAINSNTEKIGNLNVLQMGHMNDLVSAINNVKTSSLQLAPTGVQTINSAPIRNNVGVSSLTDDKMLITREFFYRNIPQAVNSRSFLCLQIQTGEGAVLVGNYKTQTSIEVQITEGAYSIVEAMVDVLTGSPSVDDKIAIYRAITAEVTTEYSKIWEMSADHHASNVGVVITSISGVFVRYYVVADFQTLGLKVNVKFKLLT